jgi:uncharacterized protein (DUF1800 family)
MLRRIILSAILAVPAGCLFAQQVTPEAASRFLEQATWGPQPAAVSHLQQIGFENWLNEQFATPPSAIPDPSPDEKGIASLQSTFFLNTLNGPDQLRQRVAFALSEIWVVSALQENQSIWMTPYWRLLAQDALGNFRRLMNDITLNPGMGRYLNMVNNDQANAAKGTTANENYARELMQLFTLGVNVLNPDGTLQLDASGNPIPTYTQADVVSMSRAFTGWTYPPAAGQSTPQSAGKHNAAYWVGPMAANEANHDTGAKTLLNGESAPAGQTAEQDLKAALDNIFNHPNAGPFLATQLIQHLVSSNPSPQYVARVARVFANDGSGARGNLQAMIRAILLDSEARAGDDPSQVDPNGGHLREPVLFLSTIYRMLGASTEDGSTGSQLSNALGQKLFYEPSVFSYFSPQYRLSGSGLPAPEFQIYSPAAAIVRANLATALVNGYKDKSATLDFSPYLAVAGNSAQLIDLIDQSMLHGTMSGGLRNSLAGLPGGTVSSLQQVKNAIALVAASPEFSIEK